MRECGCRVCTCVHLCVYVHVCVNTYESEWESKREKTKTRKEKERKRTGENSEQSKTSAMRKCARCENGRIALLICVRGTLCSTIACSQQCAPHHRRTRSIDLGRAGDHAEAIWDGPRRAPVPSGYVTKITRVLRCILTLKKSISTLRLGFIKETWKNERFSVLFFKILDTSFPYAKTLFIVCHNFLVAANYEKRKRANQPRGG